VEKKQGLNFLALILIIIIIVTALSAAVLSLADPGFINLFSGGTYVSGGAIYDAIYVILTIATDTVYLFGGGVIVFGAILVTIRFIQIKLKDPSAIIFYPLLVRVLNVKSKLLYRRRNRPYCGCQNLSGIPTSDSCD
jgi:hypothetical protein